MDEQKTTPVNEPRIYTIGEGRYRMEPLSWQQNKWLADHVFQGIDMERLDFQTIWDLFRDKGPLIMAISLLKDGTTRAQHSRQSFQTISQLAEQFGGELTGSEVAEFATYFFTQCQPRQMAMLIPGKVLHRQWETALKNEGGLSPAPGANGSSAALLASAAATSPSSAPSLPSGALVNPSPISDAASSEIPSTAPSLDGSV